MTAAPIAPAVADSTVRPLLNRLVAELRDAGDLRSPAWGAAVGRVHRHLFLPRFYEDEPKTGTWSLVSPETVGTDAWLERVYRNTTWVTQLEGIEHSADEPLPAHLTPTSSSTLPGLLMRMFERLDVQDGDRALIVGTGTGYSTALLSERLGCEQVVSVDVDPALVGRAGVRLKAAGYKPTVVTGDGLAGYPGGGPYDRLIAFCAFTDIPAAWVKQVRPGGIVVVTITGGLGAFGLLRLVINDDGTAAGRFLSDDASFMTARAQASPRPIDLKPLMGEPKGPGRRTEVSPDALNDPAFRFAAQLAMPEVLKFALQNDDGVYATYLQHFHDGSWARVEHARDGFLVLQGGPRRLWDELETAHEQWRTLAMPSVDEYGVAFDERMVVTLNR